MKATYYIDLFFVKGGGIGVVIWLLSVVAMAIAVRCFVRLRREKLFPDEVRRRVKSMFDSKQYAEAIRSVAESEDFFSTLVRRTFAHASGGRAAMEKGLLDAAEHHVSSLMRSAEWLSVIGSVAPMLGLLGTVWGMIGAFFKIVAAGSPDPRLLANDIGVALVTTLLGLIVAIPSLSIYAAMRNRIEEITGDAVMTVNELIAESQYGQQHPPQLPAGGAK